MTTSEEDRAVSGLNAIHSSPSRSISTALSAQSASAAAAAASYFNSPARPAGSYFEDMGAGGIVNPSSPPGSVFRSSVPLSYFSNYDGGVSSEQRLLGSSLTNSPNTILPHVSLLHQPTTNSLFSPFSLQNQRSPYSASSSMFPSSTTRTLSSTSRLQHSLGIPTPTPNDHHGGGAGESNGTGGEGTVGGGEELEFDVSLANELMHLKDSPAKKAMPSSSPIAQATASYSGKKLHFEEMDDVFATEEELPTTASSSAMAGTPIAIKHQSALVAASKLALPPPPPLGTPLTSSHVPTSILATAFAKFETPQLPPKTTVHRKKARPSGGGGGGTGGGDEEDEEYIMRRANAVAGIGPTSCKCKRTRCLKLYCECFAGSQMCNGDCVCTDCGNTNKASDRVAREGAIANVLSRNPDAFVSKILLSSPESAQQHAKGCNCKRSGCLKRYCECFTMTVRCSENCRCNGCQNYEGSVSLGKSLKKPKVAAVTAATAAAAAAALPTSALTVASTKKKKPATRVSKLRKRKHDDDDDDDYQDDDDEEEGDSDSDYVDHGGGGRTRKAEVPSPRSNLLPVLNASSVLGASTPSRRRALSSNTPQKVSSLASNSSAATPMTAVAAATGGGSVDWGNGVRLSASLTLLCFDYLPERDLISLSRVSTGFANIATSPELWDFTPES
ncbi:hypothetical protein BASA81_002359 [Batrachochytrium salamandrivorans]|nr:hypothetical protein BASA81_002359 [Batrachochytrium salamandrivorans]